MDETKCTYSLLIIQKLGKNEVFHIWNYYLYFDLWLNYSAFSSDILLDASKLLPYTLTLSKEGKLSLLIAM